MDIEGLKDYWEDYKVIDKGIGDYKLVVKNYPEMCELLGEKNKTGKSRILQLKEWERYFEYDKIGNQFIIREIYEQPLDKQNGKYINPIDVLNEYELYNLLTKQPDGIYDFNYMELAKELGYINNNYIHYKNRQRELTSIITGIKEKENKYEFNKMRKVIHDLYDWIPSKYKYRINKVLKKLQQTEMVSIQEYYIGIREEKDQTSDIREIRNDHGDVIEKGEFNKINSIRVTLTDEEKEKYLEIKAQEVEKFYIDGKKVTEMKTLKGLGYNYNTGETFYDICQERINKRIKSELNFNKIFVRYKIIAGKTFIENKFKELEYNIRRKGINKRFYEGLIEAKDKEKRRLIEAVQKENKILSGKDGLTPTEKISLLSHHYTKKDFNLMEQVDDIYKAHGKKKETKEQAIRRKIRKDKEAIKKVVLEGNEEEGKKVITDGIKS